MIVLRYMFSCTFLLFSRRFASSVVDRCRAACIFVPSPSACSNHSVNYTDDNSILFYTAFSLLCMSVGTRTLSMHYCVLYDELCDVKSGPGQLEARAMQPTRAAVLGRA